MSMLIFDKTYKCKCFILCIILLLCLYIYIEKKYKITTSPLFVYKGKSIYIAK